MQGLNWCKGLPEYFFNLKKAEKDLRRNLKLLLNNLDQNISLISPKKKAMLFIQLELLSEVFQGIYQGFA